MSTLIEFKITNSGKSAVFNANNTGFDLNLTHIQFGNGNRSPTGVESGLYGTIKQSAAISTGAIISATQIRMVATLSGSTEFNISEIGIWAGSPGVAGSVLFAYWSISTGKLAVKTAGVDFVFSHDMAIDAALPNGGITISHDANAALAIAAVVNHTAESDPHPQYMTSAESTAAITAHKAESDPHPQYMTSAEVDASITAHSTAADPHPVYMTAVESAAAITAHKAESDPHPVYIQNPTIDKTFYVRTTGNDNNNGLTAGTAFLTINKAWSEALKLSKVLQTDYTEQQLVVIDVGSGTFQLSGELKVVGGSTGIILRGVAPTGSIDSSKFVLSSGSDFYKITYVPGDQIGDISSAVCTVNGTGALHRVIYSHLNSYYPTKIVAHPSAKAAITAVFGAYVRLENFALFGGLANIDVTHAAYTGLTLQFGLQITQQSICYHKNISVHGFTRHGLSAHTQSALVPLDQNTHLTVSGSYHANIQIYHGSSFTSYNNNTTIVSRSFIGYGMAVDGSSATFGILQSTNNSIGILSTYSTVIIGNHDVVSYVQYNKYQASWDNGVNFSSTGIGTYSQFGGNIRGVNLVVNSNAQHDVCCEATGTYLGHNVPYTRSMALGNIWVSSASSVFLWNMVGTTVGEVYASQGSTVILNVASYSSVSPALNVVGNSNAFITTY